MIFTELEQALSAYRVQSSVTASADARQAAVAILVADHCGIPKVLLIQRADTPADPWSGQMAFPGGHRQSEDENLCATAIRETFEEVGLSLSKKSKLSQLPPHQPMNRPHGNQPLLVTPFVFHVPSDLSFELNHEVASVVWVAIKELMDGNRLTYQTILFEAQRIEVAGYKIDSHRFVWGLTFRMLQSLFKVLEPQYRVVQDLQPYS